MSILEGKVARPGDDQLLPRSPERRGRSRIAQLGDAMKVHRLATVTVAIVIVFIAFQIANSTFLGVENLWNMSVQIVPVGLLALGLVFVLLVGEIDLSSAALSGVAATIAARMAINGGEPLVVAVIVAVVVAVAFTSLEALIIVAGVPSLIVTLGGMIALGGALLVALPSSFEVNTAGTTLGNVGNFAFAPYAGWIIGALVALCCVALLIGAERTGNPGRLPIRRLVWLAAKCVAALAVVAVVVEELNRGGGFPLPLLILMVLLVAANWFLRSTSYGVHLYAVGGNRDAARRAGVRVRSFVFLSFAVLGVCSALSGLISAAYVGGVSAASGPSSLVLDAIAAVVIGGVSLSGGKGSAWAALVGAILIGSIADGVVLLGLATQVQDFVTAGMLVLAVSIDSFSFKALFRR
jgi:D-xylose transport system permease protein